MRIIGLVAAALVLEIFPAGRAMAGTFRHQHRKAARHQPRRQRAVFGLRHLRATQDVLGRGVRDHRQAETVRRRAGETAPRAPRCPDRATAPAIAARDSARLPRLARPKPALRRPRPAVQTAPSTMQSQKRLDGCMNLPDAGERRISGSANRIPHGESNPAHFLVNSDLGRGLRRAWRHRPNPASRPAKCCLRQPVCPLSVQPGKKTDAKNPQVNR